MKSPGKTNLPIGFKPAAILVQAQTQRKLQYLDEEIDEIAFLLKKKGYEVVIITNPSANRLKKVFEHPKYRDRITVFHYAGHAQSDKVELSDNQPAYFTGLADYLEQQRALRLVFLNGCSSYGFEEYITKHENEIFFVFSNNEIADYQAKEFAVRFYENLSNSHNTSCGRAFLEARGSFSIDNDAPVRLIPQKIQGGILSSSKPPFFDFSIV